MDNVFSMDGKIAELQRNVVLSPVSPEVLRRIPGGWFMDFGRDAFGIIELELDSPEDKIIELRLGEVLQPDGYLYMPKPQSPECSRRFRRLPLTLKKGRHKYRPEIPVPYLNDDYQTKGYDCTSARSIKCPAHIGEVMPFRYCEIRGFDGQLSTADVRQLAAHYRFNDNASSFCCSDARLNSVWELCKHTIKSVTYLGFYIDGDRERLPYEGDALIQQLSHFSFDSDYALSEAAIEWFFEVGTSWCYEWVLSLPLLAHRHYLYSGDNSLLARYYELLDVATLSALKRKDGLIETGKDLRNHPLVDKLRPTTGFLRDVIDWPPDMRDNYEMETVNTVANSFHFAALQAMAHIADALGKKDDSRKYFLEAEEVRQSMLKALLSGESGLFVDSEGSKHSSLHSSMFPVAYEINALEPNSKTADFLKSKGMACSVFGSQFLLESLFAANRPDEALGLMCSEGGRGWLGMIKQGATMTMESWGDAMKSAQDWNHPWGTAPANIITRHLMGIRPTAPGFTKAVIAPKPGRLRQAGIVTPTRHGQIKEDFEQDDGEFRLHVEIPDDITAEIHMPFGSIGRMVKKGVNGEGKTVFRNLKTGGYSFVAKRRQAE